MCYDELAADIYIEGQEARIAELEREVFQLRQRRYWPHTVTELCPHCTNEIEMCWNTGEYGYKAFCPVCGKRLMLCDDCRHTDGIGGCDYDSKSAACRFNRAIGTDGGDPQSHVLITVENGMVSNVYGSDARTSVVVMDLDTDSGLQTIINDGMMGMVQADIAAGKLVELQPKITQTS